MRRLVFCTLFATLLTACDERAPGDETRVPGPDPTVPADALDPSPGIVDARCTTPRDPSVTFAAAYTAYAIDRCGRLLTWGPRHPLATDDRSHLVRSPELIDPGPWRDVTGGSTHACAIHDDGTLWCWGEGPAVGLPSSAGLLTPTRVGDGSDWTSLGHAVTGSRAVETTCALRGAGELWCWGRNDGWFDPELPRDLAVPTRIGDDADWISVSVRAEGLCAVNAFEGLSCWGNNDRGQLGTGNGADGFARHWVEGSWQEVWTSDWVSCGLTVDDALWCWGDPVWMERGDFGDVLDPRPLTDVPVVDVDFDHQVLAATLADGRLATWSMWDPDATMVVDEAAGTDVIGLALGRAPGGLKRAARCVARTDGTIACSGENHRAQLGRGTTSTTATPTRISESDTFTRVIATGDGRCAVDADDTWCWGFDTLPAPQGAPARFVDLDLGRALCGIDAANQLWCRPGLAGLDDEVDSADWLQIGHDEPWHAVAVEHDRVCATSVRGVTCFALDEENGVRGLAQHFTESDWLDFDFVDGGPLYDYWVCGLRGPGEMWCGLLGAGVVERVGEATALTQLGMGGPGDYGWGACGLDRAGALHCTSPLSGEVERLPGPRWTQWDAGPDVCGVVGNGALHCETDDLFLAGHGDPSGSDALLAKPGWREAAVANGTACAIRGTDTEGGELFCWGEGRFGATGFGEYYDDTWIEVRLAR